MSARRTRQKGQALIMVTIGLVAMFGMLGLAVDLGWSFFQRKAAQAAADSAALAAARLALARVGQGGTFACDQTYNGTILECSATPTACGSFTGTLAAACTFAQQNGFSQGGNGGRQQVRVSAGVSGVGCAPDCIPTARGVVPLYWATARVTENIPQLFSAVLGNMTGTVAARATAVVIGTGVDDSIILTNRGPEASPYTGENLHHNASLINVPGGIRLASTATGDPWAGYTQGSAQVRSAYTWVRSTSVGGPLTGINDPTDWRNTAGSPNPPINRTDTNRRFRDPFEGKGQPPIGTTPLPSCPVLADNQGRGILPAGALLAPGNYYTVNAQGQATGGSITVAGNVRFTGASSGTPVNYAPSVPNVVNTCVAGAVGDGSTFGGDHILYGGLDLTGNGGTVTVEPGRYVLAGTRYPASGNQGNVRLLDLGQNGAIVDLITGETPSTSDPGTLFILTNADYPGLNLQLQNIPALQAARSAGYLRFARTNLQGGTNSIGIQLHGINPESSTLQSVADQNGAGSTLLDFGALAFWQDQANSSVVYDANGNIAGNLNNPTTRTLQYSGSPEFFYQGSANSVLWGTIYQPRGAWMRLQGGNSSAGSNRTRIVTGALILGGSSAINFGTLSAPITFRIAALVE